MTHPLVARVREAIASSELIRATASVREDGGLKLAGLDARLRPLTSVEIREMELSGNTARSWQRVRVVESFDHRRVRGCSFFGDVILGRFSGDADLPQGASLPTGVYDSTIVDCIIGHEAMVRNVRMLARYVVCEQAVLFDCSSVTSNGICRFGNGKLVRVGPQVGSRDIPVFAEIDLEVATAIAKPATIQGLYDSLTQVIARYAEQVDSPKGIFGRNAVATHVGRIERSYVAAGSLIEGASLISDSTLLGSPDETVRIGTSSTVIESVLQWGSVVGNSAIVERSVLMEHSNVDRHGKVADCIIGPNSSIEVGEATACLIGPFVGAHHQSLMISLVWPEGRGNVAHGANVGSNHTSRCADQEFWPGEGMFFGLGVNVKFPANFSRAPFSVIAPGLTTDPQRVEYPFSLITAPSSPPPGLSSTYNEIQPAWMLDQNLYALHRVESKHRERNKARRLSRDFDVIRPDTVELMRIALRRLENVTKVAPIYTEREIPGLGRNVLFEQPRQRAIAAYRQAISLFALTGLRDRCQTVVRAGSPVLLANVLEEPSDDALWEYQRVILTEDLGVNTPLAGLRHLISLLEDQAQQLEHSRAKDHTRGCRVIDDYFDRHESPGDDEIVRQVRAKAEMDCQSIIDLIGQLERVTEASYMRT